MRGRNRLAKRVLAMVATAMAVGGLSCGSAHAGPLSSDPNAYNDGTLIWRGTSSLTNSSGLSADVDWCVFGPGAYPGTAYTYGFPAVPPHSEPAADEFVYAYQLTVTGSVAVSGFSVQMLESNEAHAIGHDTTIGLPGGTIEDDRYLTWGGTGVWPNLAAWDFLGDGLGQGYKSVGLVLATVNAPLMLQGRIIDKGTFVYGDMASPSNEIPEPATLALLICGGGLVIRRRSR